VRGIVALAFVLGGCDTLLHFQHVDPADAAPLYLDCTKLSPPALFCADFSTDVYYAGGNSLPIQPATGTTTEMLTTPAVSPPTALWIDAAANDSYSIRYDAPTVTATKLDAKFSLAIPRVSSQDAQIFDLRVTNVPYDHCFAQVFIHTTGLPVPYLSIQSHCGTSANDYSYVDVVPIPLSELVPCELVFDVAAGTATLSVDGMMLSTTMAYSSPIGGNPRVTLGLLGAGGVGPRLGFDDVVVTAE